MGAIGEEIVQGVRKIGVILCGANCTVNLSNLVTIIKLIQQISTSFQVHLHLVLFSGIQKFLVYTVPNSQCFTPHLSLSLSLSLSLVMDQFLNPLDFL